MDEDKVETTIGIANRLMTLIQRTNRVNQLLDRLSQMRNFYRKVFETAGHGDMDTAEAKIRMADRLIEVSDRVSKLLDRLSQMRE